MSVTHYPQLGQGAVSVNQAFTGVSAAVALPTNNGGVVPRVVRFATTSPCRIRLGTTAGVTATSSDMLFSPQDSGEFYIAGTTHVAVIQDTAGGNLSITALEDQR